MDFGQDPSPGISQLEWLRATSCSCLQGQSNGSLSFPMRLCYFPRTTIPSIPGSYPVPGQVGFTGCISLSHSPLELHPWSSLQLYDGYLSISGSNNHQLSFMAPK